jgi:hypothetical protein
MPRRPGEYAGLALCAALYGVVLAAFAVYLAGPAPELEEGVVRGVGIVLAGLAFVTAEALWRVRPWAYRAGFALAWGTIGCFLAPAFIALMVGEVIVAVALLLAAGFIAFPVLPMVAYLKRTQPRLHPRPAP